MHHQQPLQAPRLVVASVDDKGTSFFSTDKQFKPFFPFGPQGSGFTGFSSSAKVPVSNTAAEPQLENTLPRCPPGGVWFGTSEIPPQHSAPMHRTLSCDYAAVISGEIVIRLDNGEEKTVRKGEFFVQKGGNHELHNRSSVVCRMVFVMVGAEKIVLADGKALEETVFGPPKK